MGQDTDRLRQEIEATREDLSRDVDAVSYKASPQRIVGDRVDATKTRVTGLKEKVMGNAQDATQSVSERTSMGSVTQKAEGNPFAAGVIAFGVGWLVSSLMPASQAETRLAQQGTELAKDKGRPLMEQAKDQARQVGQEMGETIKPAAQDAAESVRAKAAHGAEQVKGEGASAAQNVKGEAASQAQDARSGASGTPTTATPVYAETVDVTGTEVVEPEGGRSTSSR